MNRITEIVLTDLRHLLTEMCKDGGRMSASVYDTAQVLRWAPPDEGPGPGLEWLVSQQHADGGWGDPLLPHARDEPSLAAILALHAMGKGEREREAVRAGLEFLRKQAVHWQGPLGDDVPVGAELIMPVLLDEAARANVDISPAPYQALIELGKKRRRMLAGIPVVPAGSTPAHSWEVLGRKPEASVLDGSGGVGLSPSATAAWIHAASADPALAEHRARAREFLKKAAAATGVGIPGVVCTAWPIEQFERSFVLYALLIGGVLDHPALREVVRPHFDELERALAKGGVGFSDHFQKDADDTAAAMAVLYAVGRRVNNKLLAEYEDGDHYATYPGELQPAISVTARAVHALALAGEDHERARAYMLRRQQADGRWIGDKWNGSWLYPTIHVLLALQGHAPEAMRKAGAAILSAQHADGGWGAHRSIAEETAYAVLSLQLLRRHGLLDEAGQRALERGGRWLLHDYRPFAPALNTIWLAKVIYCPIRVARAFELVATLQAESISPSLHART